MRPRFVFLLALLLALPVFAMLWTVSRAMNEILQVQSGAPATVGDAGFVQEWSVSEPPLVRELALAPRAKGEFFALSKDQIVRFDANGSVLGRIKAPPRSTRLATDPTGAIPYLIVVSSSTKWTGAIDHVVTTDHFLHALDLDGSEVWKKRFDPKDVSALEPLAGSIDGRPVIVLSASRRLICFDASGAELWNVPLWHHPGTLAEGHAADGRGALMAALAPMRDIVSIGADGKQLGPWGKGDGPSRLRTMKTNDGMYGVSRRQVFGSGEGVQHALAFFDNAGDIIREVKLPPDALNLSYSPIAMMDVDGSGRRNWVMAFGDGRILVFSPNGEELARHSTGLRLRTLLSVPQRSGPDLLVTATDRGLTAWRPVPSRFRPGSWDPSGDF